MHAASAWQSSLTRLARALAGRPLPASGERLKKSPRQRDDRALVLPAAHAGVGEDAALGDPLARLLEDLLRSRARTRCARPDPSGACPSWRGSAPGIRSCSSACRAPAAGRCRAARACSARKNLRRSSGSGLPVIMVAIMKVRVDDLAEAELLGEVIRPARTARRPATCRRAAAPCA